MSSSTFRRASIAAALTLACAACTQSGARAIGTCTQDCQDQVATEVTADAGLSGNGAVERGDAATASVSEPRLDAAPPVAPVSLDAATGTTVSTTQTGATSEPNAAMLDAGERSAFERQLTDVDELVDYGYEDDPLLFELSRAAGHAGIAVCLCAEGVDIADHLVGCALDEGTYQLWPLPIDFEESMQCVRDGVGSAALERYAQCATEVLREQVQCYFERQASDQCSACVPNYKVCPESDTILGANEVCSPYDGDPPPRTRRAKGESAEP